MIDMPSGALDIINRLQRSGFEAYIVGGCVRDMILGRKPHDWDVCTSATPDEMKRVFSDCNVYDTGTKHGTLTIRASDGSLYEVTTFRVDGAYSDHRRPDTVRFTDDLLEDLSRRDFTMNAMAFSGTKNHLIDPFDGLEDIKAKAIRCVGGADERFNEDALRILRALRFAAVFGFGIEKETSDAIHRNRNLLDHIAAERINAELCKLISGRYALPVLLNYSDVIAQIIPEFSRCIGFDQNNRYHVYTVYEHIMRALDYYKGDDPIVRLTLFFHDIGKPSCYTEDERGGHFHGHGIVSSEMICEIMKRLRFDNATKDAVTELVLYHDSTIEPTAKTVRRWLNKIGAEQFERLLDIRMCDMLAHSPDTQQSHLERNKALRVIYQEISANETCFHLKDLAINGRDIMSLGVPQGKKVGEILNKCLGAVLDGEVENNTEALLERAKQFMEKQS